jgi:hypothetical protein
MKLANGKSMVRGRALRGTALPSILLKAVFVAAGASAIHAPEALAQCAQSSNEVICEGSNSGGIDVGPGTAFPTATAVTVRNRTQPITPTGDGVRLTRPNAVGPAIITLDDTVEINLNNAPNVVAHGVVARDTVQQPGQPVLTINSAANITLNSNFTSPLRGNYFNTMWRANNAQGEINYLLDGLGEAELIGSGVDLYPPSHIFDPVMYTRLLRLSAANCLVNGVNPGFIGTVFCFISPPPTDRIVFEEQVAALIGQRQGIIDFENGPVPPELALQFARAALYAHSTGINWNPSGHVVINNSGNLTTTGDFAFGILGRTETLHGEFVPVGGITISNSGIITTAGNSSPGIVAHSRSQFSDWPMPAGAITITGDGDISTAGVSSYGIYAGSFGGFSDHGGGDAAGADGGTINVTYGGLIETQNVDAIGIWAESRGGLGGYGDDAEDFRESYAGGFGGHGGTATVTVNEGGGVVTHGDRAHAIYAVSAAGSGGEGGAGYLDSWQPSRGGGGGNGGEVTVINNGLLATYGDDAFGVTASSLAGAGGAGGGDSGFFDPGRGATGGPAGRGGTVTVTNAAGGIVQTAGDGSIGLFAQSVGGLGGQGGRASSMFDPRGGVGGTAAHPRCQAAPFICPDGGAVTMGNAGIVVTDGDFAQGMFAQSIGGGGGLGGRASGWFFVDGGDGGDAGKGGTVAITNSGQVQTSGAYSVGIFAQSVGGGGGAGGDAFAGGNLAAVALGGDGGAGGRGGLVTVINESTGVIVTNGQRSDGIFAQSVGGGGGSGGSAYSFAFGGGFAAAIAIGGSGGDGGGAGELVSVENHGQIHANGDFSNGIVAQSVGGGGGIGGAAYSFAASVGIEGSLAVSVSVGGSGAGGGDGGDVLVKNFGGISTYDFNGFGVLAQSVGGGGGAGGSSTAHAIAANAKKGAAVAVSVAIGGNGGGGGDGAHARVENSGMIVTFGDGSTGIFAQSVGGGGGVGGDASAATETISGGKSGDVKVDVSVGGAGGAAGNGGLVEVVNHSTIVTLGYMANGITGQSVGGGGGVGGVGEQGNLFEDMGIPEMPEFEDDADESRADRQRARNRYGNLQTQARSAVGGSDSLGRSGKKAGKDSSGLGVGIGVGIGGQGGAAGDGGTVDIDNFGEIITAGRQSMGIFAQSVGGGGGAGGGGSADGSGDVGVGVGLGGDQGGSGDGGQVLVNNVGDITTLQEEAFGIFAQSVGGGGGFAGLGAGGGEEKHNFSLSIGGDAAEGGNGDLVDVDQTGDVLTLGYASIGVFAQSIGGGGGYGGSAEQDAFASVSLGGQGGVGGDGGTVDVTVLGNVTTEGDFAHAVFAQSVGGGGGLGGGIGTSTYVHTIDVFGGIDIDTGLTIGVGALGLSGNGGAAGNGGTVTVSTAGTITTFGEGAHGIVAQSVAGGGGMGGSGGVSLPLAIAEAGSNGGVGTAETVTVTHNGAIRTFGENAIGIWAQSVDGADVGCTEIECLDEPRPILDGRGKAITITLNNGEIIGGSGPSGAGIFISGGAANQIINRGGRISALSGNAILATDGDDRILNSGLIDGNVGLGGGINAFVNESGGLFVTRDAIFLGAGNQLSNAGIVSPYGSETAGTTRLAGNFVQGAGGVFRVNLNFDGPSDLLIVEGSASLGGSVSPIVRNATDLETGTYVTVLQATSLMDAGVSMDLADTLVIDYATRFQGNNFQIGIADIDFDIASLGDQQSSLAGHIQDIWNAGGSAEFEEFLNRLAFETDAEAYAEVLDGLHPYGAFSGGNHPITEGQAFLGGMMSCPESEGWTKPLRETACGWVRGSFNSAKQEAVAGAPEHSTRSGRMQGGQQFEFGDGWFAGFSAGYEAGTFDQAGGANSRTDSLHLGGAVKREMGSLLLAGAVDVGYSDTDRVRLAGFPSLSLVKSSNGAAQVSARLRAAYTAEFGNGFYLKPSVDIDGYFIRTDGFTETGAGAFGLTVADSEETLGAGTVSLGGGYLAKMGDMLLHPYAEAGFTRLSTGSTNLMAHLQGAPTGVGDFAITTVLPQELASGRIGLEALMPDGSLRLEYEHRDGDGYLNRSISAKVRLAF